MPGNDSRFLDELIGLPPGSRVQRMPTQVYEPEPFDKPMTMEPMHLQDHPGHFPDPRLQMRDQLFEVRDRTRPEQVFQPDPVQPLPDDVRAAMINRVRQDQAMSNQGTMNNQRLDMASRNSIIDRLEDDRILRSGYSQAQDPSQEMGREMFLGANRPSAMPQRPPVELERDRHGMLGESKSSVLEYLLSKAKGK